MKLIAELKRRHVFRIAIAYVVVAWVVLQVSDVILNNIDAPGWVFSVIMLLVGIGCLILAFGSILGAVLVYLPVDPEFSIFTTYLSDIGDLVAGPQ